MVGLQRVEESPHAKLLYKSITILYLLYTPSPCFNPFPHETMKRHNLNKF